MTRLWIGGVAIGRVAIGRPAITLAVVAVLVAGCRRKTDADNDAGSRQQIPSAATLAPVRIVYPAAPGSFVDLAAAVGDAVVNVRASAPVAGGPATVIPGAADKLSLGSGFIISNDGHILTNDHFIAASGAIEVRLKNGQTYPAMIIGRDARLDVALIKIEAPPPLPTVRQGSSDDLQVGEWVLALGNPFGSEVVATAGIVSGVGITNHGDIAGPRAPNLENFLSTDARITALHSGGPLVNTAGEVVGIATAVEAKGGAVGFAVPINRAALILPMLKENGSVQRAWVGIYVREVDAERARALELPHRTGALVTDIVAGGPGASAGLKRGDVIVSFDGRAVSHRNLPALVATAGIGRMIELVVLRGGGRQVVSIESGSMPE